MIRAMRRTLLRLLSDRKSVFLIGFLIGAFLAIVLHIYQTVVSKARAKEALASRRNYDFAYERWLRSAEGLESFDVDPDIGRYNFSQEDIKAREANFLHDKVPCRKSKKSLAPVRPSIVQFSSRSTQPA